jgi:hypothetical protein
MIGEEYMIGEEEEDRGGRRIGEEGGREETVRRGPTCSRKVQLYN